MNRLLIISVILLIHIKIFGQVAIIQDPDGYTNVRLEPNTGSEVIYELKENEVFFYSEENFGKYENIKDWVTVIIPINKFSIQLKESNTIIGFIHKSRLKPIEKLDKISIPEVKLRFVITKVNIKTKRSSILTKNQNNTVYQLVDGFIPYGLESELKDATEVTSLDLITNKNEIPQTDLLINDLYNMEFKSDTLLSIGQKFNNYRNGNISFIEQDCGDGAGYYKIVWVIDCDKIIQRLVGNIY